MKRIVFISGSLRKKSYNRAILEEAEKILGKKFECHFLSYSNLPLLSQDIEFPENEYVSEVRKEIRNADAIFIASPEYNHSYSGVLKNLLDWLSRPTVRNDYSTAVIRGKIVAIASAAGSSGGSYSIDKLKEILTLLSCRICPVVTQVALGARFSSDELVLDDEEKAILEKECNELSLMLEEI